MLCRAERYPSNEEESSGVEYHNPGVVLVFARLSPTAHALYTQTASGGKKDNFETWLGQPFSGRKEISYQEQSYTPGS